jgi:hypothetical protein
VGRVDPETTFEQHPEPVKLQAICDKHGSLLDLELTAANVDDRAGAQPMLPRLAALGFQGDRLGDSGFNGAPFAQTALAMTYTSRFRLTQRPRGASCRLEFGGWLSVCSRGSAATAAQHCLLRPQP